MMNHFARAAAAALLFCAAAPSTAAIPAAPAAAKESVVIPFDPPLGQKLRYRSKTDKDGRVDQADMTVEFRKSGDAWVMTLTYLLPPGAPAGNPMVALLSQPVSLRLNEAGEIVGMENESAYWDAMTRAFLSLPGTEKDPAAAARVRGMLDEWRSMPEEARLNLLAGRIEGLLAYASTEHVPGEAIEEQGEMQTVTGTLTQTVRQTLDRVQGQSAFFTTVSTIPPEQFEAMVKRLMEKGPPDAKPTGTLRVTALETRREAEVDTGTGLSLSFQERKTISGEESGKRETHVSTIKLERVR